MGDSRNRVCEDCGVVLLRKVAIAVDPCPDCGKPMISIAEARAKKATVRETIEAIVRDEDDEAENARVTQPRQLHAPGGGNEPDSSQKRGQSGERW